MRLTKNTKRKLRTLGRNFLKRLRRKIRRITHPSRKQLVPDPSEDEIRAACEEIRAGWGWKTESLRRRGFFNQRDDDCGPLTEGRFLSGDNYAARADNVFHGTGSEADGW